MEKEIGDLCYDVLKAEMSCVRKQWSFWIMVLIGGVILFCIWLVWPLLGL
jgi:hypothetical protein